MRWVPVVSLLGCAYPQPENVGGVAQVTGTAKGLWDGSSGLRLRLAAARSQDLEVPGSGAFAFPEALDEQAAFVIKISDPPERHDCMLADGSGTIEAGVPTAVPRVLCAGPAFDVFTSPVVDDTIDAYEQSILLRGSMLTQEIGVGVTGGGAIDGASIAGAPALDATAPYAAGAAIELASADLSARYQLVLDHGRAVEQRTIVVPSGGGPLFGQPVLVDGDTLAIGACPGNGAQAAMHVYRLRDGTWQPEQRITAPPDFGCVAALSGDTLVLGAPTAKDETTPSANVGRVFIYQRTGSSWSGPTNLDEPVRAGQRYFGRAVAISGDTLAVATADPSARVHVFARGSDNAWTPVKALAAPSGDAGFGAAIALAGDVLAIGAPSPNAPQQGALHVYRRTPANDWVPEVVPRPAATSLGRDVSFDGETVAVSSATCVIPFTASSGAWAAGMPVCKPHQRVHVLGRVLVLLETTTSPASAYLYEREAGAWIERKTLAVESLGAGAALSRSQLVIGLPGVAFARIYE